MTSRFVELSHPIEDGMVTYPGLPAPLFSEHLSRADSANRYSPGTTFSIGRLEIVGNTGTYVDAPFHRFAEGVDLAGLPLDRLADLEAVCVDARNAGRRIDAAAFAEIPVGGRAVLVWTGWDARWRTAAYGDGSHPCLTAGAAAFLVSGKAALVGIDSLNIDDVADGSRPAHTQLLRAGIPIVEHLTNLGAIARGAFRLFAVPPPFRGFSSFPARVFAIRA